MASVARYCCCGDPCGCTTSPNSATSTGITDNGADCSAEDQTYTFNTFSETTDYCTWNWAVGSDYVEVSYAKNAFTTGTCSVSVSAGEYVILLVGSAASTGYAFGEITTGFSCNAGTGKISGTHTFSGPCPFSTCGGTPTVTVPA